MLEFKTADEAKEFALENGHKYGSDVVLIDGKKTWVSTTSLPLEERFRTPIENALRDFFKEMGYDDDDSLRFIGAEVSAVLIDKIKEVTPLGIECAYANF